MKLAFWILFIGLLIALASTAVIPEEEYLPPALEEEQVAEPQPIDDTAALADDGYRYKTVKKLRHRRDVSELVAPESAVIDDDGYHYRSPKPAAPLEKVSNEYLPPREEASEIKEASEAPEVSNEYLPPANEVPEVKEASATTEAAAISEAPVISEEPEVPEVAEVPEVPEVPEIPEVPELPEVPKAAEVTNQYLPPADDSEVVEGPPETAVLADDGYHYRSFRNRRDVSEIVAPKNGYLYEAPAATEEVSNLYLPPAEVKEADAEPSSEEPQVANDYLPPVAEVKEAPEVDEVPAETSELAEDGYRYKTIRRLKYRHRRDVSEIVAPKSGYLYEAPAATEDVSNTYLPPAEVKEADAEPSSKEPQVANEYLPPVAEVKEAPEVDEVPAETSELAEDGYRYKTIRRLKYRHRRDVSEIVAPKSGYLYEAPAATEDVSNTYLPPAEVKEADAEPSSEEPQVANEYLPPVAEVKEAPEVDEVPAETSELAEDGYRYKTIRRLKYRHRRDVSEIVAPKSGYLYEAPAATEDVSNTYLPPAEVKEADAEPSSEEPQVANDYLPPVAEVKEAPEVDEVPAETSELAEDGYRYKTIRRLKYRHRRDVSEIVAPKSGYLYEAPAATEEISNTYLPPAEVKEADAEPSSEEPQVANDYLPPVAEVKEAPEVDEVPAETSELAEDGYRYKTIRRLKYRHRRDVSEIVAPKSGYLYEAPAATEEVSNLYLPPAEVKEADAEPSSEEPQVANDYLPPVAEVKEAPEVDEVPAETSELAEDGYRYKTIRRLKYRHRRDVSEIVAPKSGYLYEAPAATDEVSNTYLPPAEIKKADAEPSSEEPQVANEYLPPVAEVKEAPEVDEVPAETSELADDGYRYKTIRRLKYRQRRDVSELVAPEESAILADDGYHYKTPEASEAFPKISNEYLPPANELAAPKEAPQVPETSEPSEGLESLESLVSAEAPTTTEAAPVVTEASTTPEAPKVSNEYLPPAEELPKLKEASEVPEETAVLADDGYHYKVGKRFRFRRDVSEIIAPSKGYLYEPPVATNEASNVYLPPAEVKEAEEPSETPQVSNEYLPPAEESNDDAEIVEAPKEAASLAEDGYRYRTIRRLKYRHRRDVSEIVAPQNGYFYPSPVRNAVDIPVEIPIESTVGSPADSTILADDGYRYKTVRRIRYRHRRDVSELVAPVEKSAVLAEDGYHYNNPEEIKNIANEYLPPVDAVAEVKGVPEVAETGEVVEAAIPTESPEIPQVSNEYLPPAVAASDESAALADDGYHYKTVRRIRYRHRRDVSEIAHSSADGYVYQAPEASEHIASDPVTIEATVSEPVTSEPISNEYIPPVAEIKEATVPSQPTEAIPEVSNEYLPPADETKDDATIVDAKQESAVLADDGYRYKTVHRIRYRRDVSETVSPQEPGYLYNAPVETEPEVKYLPPAEVAEIKDADEVPEDTSALAEDGYRLKTVRRLRYRHRV